MRSKGLFEIRLFGSVSLRAIVCASASKACALVVVEKNRDR